MQLPAARPFPPEEERAELAPPAGQVRVLVVGDSGVGKTSLVHLITQGQPTRNPRKTVGCNVSVKFVDLADKRSLSPPGRQGAQEMYGVRDQPTRGDRSGRERRGFFVELWDVSGREEYQSTRSIFFSQISGVIFVHDLSRRKSRLSALKWLEEVTKGGTFSSPSKPHSPGLLPVPLLVIGNKGDIPEIDPVHRGTAKLWEALKGSRSLRAARSWGQLLERVGFKPGADIPEYIRDSRSPGLVACAREGRLDMRAIMSFFVELIERRYFMENLPPLPSPARSWSNPYFNRARAPEAVKPTAPSPRSPVRHAAGPHHAAFDPVLSNVYGGRSRQWVPVRNGDARKSSYEWAGSSNYHHVLSIEDDPISFWDARRPQPWPAEPQHHQEASQPADDITTASASAERPHPWPAHLQHHQLDAEQGGVQPLGPHASWPQENAEVGRPMAPQGMGVPWSGEEQAGSRAVLPAPPGRKLAQPGAEASWLGNVQAEPGISRTADSTNALVWVGNGTSSAQLPNSTATVTRNSLLAPQSPGDTFPVWGSGSPVVATGPSGSLSLASPREASNAQGVSGGTPWSHQGSACERQLGPSSSWESLAHGPEDTANNPEDMAYGYRQENTAKEGRDRAAQEQETVASQARPTLGNDVEGSGQRSFLGSGGAGEFVHRPKQQIPAALQYATTSQSPQQWEQFSPVAQAVATTAGTRLGDGQAEKLLPLAVSFTDWQLKGQTQQNMEKVWGDRVHVNGNIMALEGRPHETDREPFPGNGSSLQPLDPLRVNGQPFVNSSQPQHNTTYTDGKTDCDRSKWSPRRLENFRLEHPSNSHVISLYPPERSGSPSPHDGGFHDPVLRVHG